MLDYNLRYEWIVYNSERTFKRMGWFRGESICSCRFGPINDCWNLRFYPQGTGRRRENPALRLCREMAGVHMKLEGYLFIKPDDKRDDETIVVNTYMHKLSTFINLPLNVARNWISLNQRELAIEINIRITEIDMHVTDINRRLNSTQVEETTVQTDIESEIQNVPNNLMPITDMSALFNLSRDMRAMYERKDQSDLTLICESIEFQVHKCVLSARSSIFASMFQHYMTESKDNRVNINDIDASVLEQVIAFIYTGRIKALSYAMARDLYSAADKYVVLELKDICCQFIISSLCTSTAVEILILADTHNDALLKNTTISFISTNFENLNTTDEWLSLLKERSSLAIEVLTFAVTQLKLVKHNQI